MQRNVCILCTTHFTELPKLELVMFVAVASKSGIDCTIDACVQPGTLNCVSCYARMCLLSALGISVV